MSIAEATKAFVGKYRQSFLYTESFISYLERYNAFKTNAERFIMSTMSEQEYLQKIVGSKNEDELKLLEKEICDNFGFVDYLVRDIVEQVYLGMNPGFLFTQSKNTSASLCCVVNTSNKQNLINNKNEIILAGYDHIYQLGRKNYYFTTNNKEAKIIKIEKNKVVEIISGYLIASVNKEAYDDSVIFLEKTVKWNEKYYGAIDYEGNIIIPFEYEKLQPNLANSKYVAAKKNGKWGLINLDNSIRIHFRYDNAFEVNDNVWVVSQSEYFGALDCDGNLVIPFKYHRLSKFEKGYAFAMEYSWQLCGVIDKNNNTIIPFKYDNCFHDNYDGSISCYEYVIQNSMQTLFVMTKNEKPRIRSIVH